MIFCSLIVIRHLLQDFDGPYVWVLGIACTVMLRHAGEALLPGLGERVLEPVLGTISFVAIFTIGVIRKDVLAYGFVLIKINRL